MAKYDFTFRRKGELRHTTIHANLAAFQLPTAHNIAANVVACASVALGASRPCEIALSGGKKL